MTTGLVSIPVELNHCKHHTVMFCQHVSHCQCVMTVLHDVMCKSASSDTVLVSVCCFSFSGESMSMKRDNPLYESQEIRMEMFADASDEETEGEME